MKKYLLKYFDEKNISKALSILSSYEDSETKRVKKVIIKLAAGSIDGLKYFTDCANKDYRDVLYWAEYPDEAENFLKKLYGGMTVNERLFHLNLFDQFDSAIKKKDENMLREVLKKCHLSEDNIEGIVKINI